MKQRKADTPDAEPLPAVTTAVAATAKKTALVETAEGHPWVSNQEIKKESNPFTERDPRMLMYAWFGLAVRVLVVFGGIFSVVQFLAARERSGSSGRWRWWSCGNRATTRRPNAR